jgi:hypothetical protein
LQQVGAVNAGPTQREPQRAAAVGAHSAASVSGAAAARTTCASTTQPGAAPAGAFAHTGRATRCAGGAR